MGAGSASDCTPLPGVAHSRGRIIRACVACHCHWIANTKASRLGVGCPSLEEPVYSFNRSHTSSVQGVNLLIRVDQFPSAARTPAAPGVGAQVPSLLSPLPPAKKGPPHAVKLQGRAMYSLAIQIELPSTAAAP